MRLDGICGVYNLCCMGLDGICCECYKYWTDYVVNLFILDGIYKICKKEFKMYSKSFK